MNTEARIREIIANVTQLSREIPEDANLYLDLGVASVYALHLLTELEQSFDVAIPDEEFVAATSVAKLTRLMNELTGDRQEVASA